MNNKIIFMAGVHGVGKTTLCKYISERYNIRHYSASKLISDFKKESFTSLLIKDIDENQSILINAINTLLSTNEEYLLDGHFCLFNEFGDIEKIPEKTFEVLDIKKIIVLIENVDTVSSRLKNRSGIECDIDILSELQKMELDYSHKIASMINVPYVVLDISSMNQKLLNSRLDKVFL